MVKIMAQPKLSLIQGKKVDQFTDTYVNINDGVLQKKVPQQKPINKLDIDKQTLVKLSNRLHTQLEIEKLINIFADEIKPMIHLDDIIYKLPEEKTKINNKGRHYASYNMEFNDVSSGIIFLFLRQCL